MGGGNIRLNKASRLDMAMRGGLGEKDEDKECVRAKKTTRAQKRREGDGEGGGGEKREKSSRAERERRKRKRKIGAGECVCICAFFSIQNPVFYSGKSAF